ncbi:MoaB/Mog domain-containing protein [Suillus subalutaceus]|uniref:MoaB/Mog domain-containing protein n=1 Tax=Suillus subalutaceus TaxID=48586 RepID=UPI001B86C4CA|nr:MoaB/Mog domain-containing protein [Suillus subalutaceus]KAG1872888.1 MoaB/Mog domain-containing protein [Suillus subalutaceus]
MIFFAQCAMHPRTLARLTSLSTHIRRTPLRPAHSRRMSCATVPPDNATFQLPPLNFAISPVPKHLSDKGRHIKTAAALIIGDEILNGKTLDRNSNYFARFCFEHGIQLKRVEVIADDEAEICSASPSIEASRRMVETYDFVVTSGGIGPTHDDITYASLAKESGKYRAWISKQSEEQRTARKRMALFPDAAEVIFVASDIWVPVVRLQGKLCIFPGIPSLFQKMLDNLKPFLPLPPEEERPFRLQVFTALPESSIAPFLTDLQKRVQPEGIRIGSYPVLQKGVYVSLIGADRGRVHQLGVEVEKEVDGRAVTEAEAEAKRQLGCQ